MTKELKAVDLVTTAKLRALVKKLNIPYVDATASNFPRSARGIHIWQLGDSICFKTYNDVDRNYRGDFVFALEEMGLTVRQTITIFGECTGTFNIVPKLVA